MLISQEKPGFSEATALPTTTAIRLQDQIVLKTRIDFF